MPSSPVDLAYGQNSKDLHVAAGPGDGVGGTGAQRHHHLAQAGGGGVLQVEG